MVDYILADTPLSIALQVHKGMGVVIMGAFTILFAKSYRNTLSEKSRMFKALPLISAFFKMFYYILTLTIYTTQDPALQSIGPVFLQFFSWFVTTPLILSAIALLDTNVITDVFYLCTLNSVMIISGYFAHVATHLGAIWSFYGFSVGCAYFIANSMFRTYKRIKSKKIKTINNKTYMLLCVYTSIVWCLFPFTFILYKTGVLPFEVQSIFYVYLDIFAKGVFGVILIGARDMMDKKQGRMVQFAKTVIHVYTPLKSLTEEETVTDDESLTPPPSLEELTPAEKDFITGKTPLPSKPHTIIPIDDAKWSRTSRNSVRPTPQPQPQKKLVRANSSPAHLTRGRT